MKVQVQRRVEMELGDFAEKYELEMIVRERSRDRGRLTRYYASFDNLEIKDGAILTSSSGQGDTIVEAIQDYVPRISNKLLIKNPYKDGRQEIRAPELYFNGHIE